jgi:RNA polymerase sigma factor (sigma-70 family)
MATRQSGIVLERIQTLFQEGRIETMTDGQLLQRFAAHRAEAERAAEAAGLAFEVLVLRHGPMVLGVCRRVLRDPHEVEDAFQATFLILARRAGSVRKPEVVGGWLRKVAYRVATRARALSNRRAAIQPARPVSSADDAGTILEQGELRTAVLDEVQLLPEKYRLPVQICYLEGQTHDEAARRLHWPVGTVRTRLALARARLRDQLTRRGVVLPAGFIGTSLISSTASAVVPAMLVKATVEAATGRVVRATASSLATSALRAIFMLKLKMAILLVVVTSSLGWVVLPFTWAQVRKPGADVAARVRQGADTGPADSETKAQQQPAPGREVGTVFFRVVENSTKKPLPGVLLKVWLNGKISRQHTTDESGRLVIPVPKEPFERLTITARGDGLVPMRVYLRHFASRETEIPRLYTLAMEHGTSIGGIVRDDDGRAIEGVIVSLYRNGPEDRGSEALDFQEITARTDAQGRWHLDLIPAALDLGHLQFSFSHPDFLSPIDPINMQPSEAPEHLRQQNGVTVLRKGIVITGRVFDRDGHPLARASVRMDYVFLPSPGATTTDSAGRFRIANAAAGETVLTAQAAVHAPEMMSINIRPGLAPVEFRLGPGRSIRGQVVDSQGRPIAGAIVGAFQWRGHQTLDWRADTDADGRFRWDDAPIDEFSVSAGKTGYLSGTLLLRPSDKEPVMTLRRSLRLKGTVTDAETGLPIGTFTVVPAVQVDRRQFSWMYVFAKTFHEGRYELSFEDLGSQPKRARIEAKGYLPESSPGYQSDAGEQVFDVRLKKGEWIEGVVRGPDGLPLSRAEVVLVSGNGIYLVGSKTYQRDSHAHLVTGVDGQFSFSPPDGPYRLIALHDRGYAEGTVEHLAAARDMIVAPWGRIEGTLPVGGAPLAHATVVASLNDIQGRPELLGIHHLCRGQIDEQGRFVIDRVAPGEARVYRQPYDPGARDTLDRYYQPAFVDVVPGRASRVDLIEEGGSPLVGRIVAIDERGRQLELAGTSAFLSVKVPDVPYPPNVAPEDRPNWLSEWSRTPAAAEYRHSRRGFSHTLKLQSNGSFRIDEVQPGAYTLQVHAKGFTDLTFDVTVGAAAAGERREAMDVGTLTLKRPVTSETGR